MLYRNKYYNLKQSDDQASQLIELIIAKQRNGPIGTVKLNLMKNRTKFFNLNLISYIMLNAQNQIRTGDTRIFNPLLYQLSYPGFI